MTVRVVVLGCGPAGLIAAAAARVHDRHAGLTILSNKRKSTMYGAQYLHQPIPYHTPSGLDGIANIQYTLAGSTEEYRRKVYGDRFVGAVSPEELAETHLGWDIRMTYDNLWDEFEPIILQREVGPPELDDLLNDPDIDLVISSIPLQRLCHNGHTFQGTEIWAAGEAPEVGIKLPFNCADDTVMCNGKEYPSWYRLARIFGRTTVEWPGRLPKPPIGSVTRVTKPTKHNCDCWTNHPKFFTVGRYGSWDKSQLSHHAFDATTERLQKV